MTNNPIERLRNRLSPFTSLVDILNLEVLVNGREISLDPGVNLIVKDVIKRAVDNKDDIQKYLGEADALLDRLGFETKEITEAPPPLPSFLQGEG